MKKFLTLVLFCVASASLWAQTSFQGTITYTWKVMGEGAEMAEAYMPTAQKLMVRKGDKRVRFEGGMLGMMLGDILTLAKKNTTYMIKDADSKALKLKADEEELEGTEKPVVTKEDEVIDILGYSCQKYKIEAVTGGVPTTQYMWTTDKISMPGGAGAVSLMGGSSSKIEGLEGFPMKIMINQGGMTIIMTVSDVSNEVPDKELFKIPKGYKVEDFDPASMGMGM